MSKILEFLSKRRSVTAKMMSPGHLKIEDLKNDLKRNKFKGKPVLAERVKNL